MSSRRRFSLGCIAFLAVLAGCATVPHPTPSHAEPVATATSRVKDSPLRFVALDRELEERILALDPEHITDADVAMTLSKAPAPQIMLVHGGIWPVHLMMQSTGKFLVAMGYPEARVRHPGDRRWSHSPYENSAHLAGLIAWYFEHQGLRPMMIGHSQGGIQAVKVLYELAGRFQTSIPVWDPYTDQALDRTTIVDPLVGDERPVVGLSLSYMATVGAGGITLLLPNQWSMLDKMYTIPDTVEQFTGYTMLLDPIGLNWTWNPNGTATVRNVLLPLSYNHLTTPDVGPLASNRAARDWINAYQPGGTNPEPPQEPIGYATVWAADVWYDVKKHWTVEAQRLIRAKRNALGAPSAMLE